METAKETSVENISCFLSFNFPFCGYYNWISILLRLIKMTSCDHGSISLQWKVTLLVKPLWHYTTVRGFPIVF